MSSLIPRKSFYFIRHGESEANRLEIMCGGGVDTPLSRTGLEQALLAQKTLRALKQNRPNIIYHTQLSRTMETADIINRETDLPVIASPELRERHMGDWEGKPWKELAPHVEKKEEPPNGESLVRFHERMEQTLAAVLARHACPLIVGHGGFWRALSALYGHMPEGWPENALLYRFDVSPDTSIFPWKVSSYRVTEDGKDLEIRDVRLFLDEEAGP